MKVTVITVAFNAAKTIGDTLRSVAEQSHPDIEHIIIDGGSTDETLEVVRRFSHVSLVLSEHDQGLYDAMNKGAKLATGDIIGWLNADDFLSGPDALAAIVRAAESHAVDIIAGSIDMVSQHDVDLVVRHYSSVGFVPNDLRFGFAPPHPGFYIRRGAFVLVGDYNLDYKIGADFDLLVRAIYVNRLTFKSIADVVVNMRVGGRSSGLSAYSTSFKENYRSLKSHDIPTNPLFLSWKYVRKIKQFVAPNSQR